jgi:hypothetical protein
MVFSTIIIQAGIDSDKHSEHADGIGDVINM